ncbi:hypothetical protein C7Y71_003765 [Pseudoprevotella muciniphila]|uniref:Uncharacterized protein n=1 Tax=Pseudoprevotella muciniphila TaxID=2133944 RepID=A0A5P8E5J7_9BACT|nr:hypothetical protein [Pseudoprevotella muciniphila]QFQ12208.1 hypothetical protein C7Y71_003765 [Pseudoprevotella muciniphila]
MTPDNIISETLLLLNLEPSEEGATGVTPEQLITSRINNALRLVASQAPVTMLGNGKAFADTVGWESRVGYGAGYVVLPDDFFRLITFRMSDWQVAVTETIASDNPLYLRQQSRWSGLRGTPQNPVVAIVQGDVGRVLEFYCCNSGPSVSVRQARYFPLPQYDFQRDTEVDVPERLLSAFLCRLASLVAGTLGQADLAQRLEEQSRALMMN